MSRLVGLLRGVNVGGKNRLPMGELRALVESLGHTDVVTFIQSGNVIFSAHEHASAASLREAIRTSFGIDVAVALRTPTELAAVVRANPFPHAEPSTLHVGFMAEQPSPAALAELEHERFLPDEFALGGSELYLHLPAGMARTKLPAYLDRRLKVPITVRNWNTVTTLLELAGA